MVSTYRRRTEITCDRLIWAWADAAMVGAGHYPELIHPGARRLLAGSGSHGQVVVIARVPAGRCLITSHVLWDALVLRGRLIPLDLEDALAFHAAHGSCLLNQDADSPADDAIFHSWRDRCFRVSPDPADYRLQVCLDRIEPDEIVGLIEVDDQGRSELPWLGPAGAVGPRPLTDPSSDLDSDAPF
jgi:hypothetical protein